MAASGSLYGASADEGPSSAASAPEWPDRVGSSFVSSDRWRDDWAQDSSYIVDDPADEHWLD